MSRELPTTAVPPAGGDTELASSVVVRLRAAGCVYAEDEAALLVDEARDTDELERLIARRSGGVPLELVVGWAEFCGRRFGVAPGVFVPRRRSEFLVEQAVGLGRAGMVVVDLCCGSGAIGASVAARLGGVDLHAADLDPAAVRCAHDNLAHLHAEVHEGDLFDALPARLRGRIDLLLANAPYVPSGEVANLPREARLYEPLLALDGGPDGLGLHQRIIVHAPDWLAPGGHLLVETTDRQAPTVAAAMADVGLTPTVAVSDHLDVAVTAGHLPP
ncbi:MAG TPA: putative protein N(5)-glutamine methyltransferase [Egicoccus sp.]|nr:putative protein N(5)-glutamine methyltransferase [Egicoccus sp.]HSK23212.1 putative protein N(5)-glutamine methyltransferase [Egicoccus sp.]